MESRQTTSSAVTMKQQDEPATEIDSFSSLSRRQSPRPVKRIKRDFRGMLLPQRPACRPCSPSQGLAIGSRPITVAELNQLSPDDLTEQPITRNGVELTMEELLELLDMPKEFAELVDAVADNGDNQRGMTQEHEDETIGASNAVDNSSGAPFIPPNADEFMYLAFSNQFR